MPFSAAQQTGSSQRQAEENHTEAPRLSQSADIGPDLKLTRAARPWEFLDAVGTRAAIFGSEDGAFEAWVYPFKLLRDFRLTFRTRNRVIPAHALVRTVSVRPESATLVYSDDDFSVRETWFVPVDEPGAIILLEIDSHAPVEIQASFERDFQLMWPAALGGTSIEWINEMHAFGLGEAQQEYYGFIGSPTARAALEEYDTNYARSHTSSFVVGDPVNGHATYVIGIAGSVQGRAKAEQTYRRLLASYNDLLAKSAEYYRQYLADTISLTLPDQQLQRAYDWSRISTAQGLVTNPFLGTGLVAGYKTSGEGARPGFAWYFGRDSMWTALALDSTGDFKNARTALAFLSKYQRQDGKVPHEISQSATLVPWFDKFPYPWASADATPLLILGLHDYVRSSGDVAFAREKWDNAWRAYQFLKSTYGPDGFARNEGVGHGWVEGGPLLPVRTELYQSGLAVASLRALADLARITGHSDVAAGLDRDFAAQQKSISDAFWSTDKNILSFALDPQGQRVEIPSVLVTAPMWFGIFDPAKADRTINALSTADHATDWGMRIISAENPLFNPAGYHFGSVWPLFTGWASVGEYTYHRATPAYANLRTNALLALDGSPGRITEVLSGSYYEPLSTSSPHQIWSSAMVMNSMLRGMLGLSVNALSKNRDVQLTFSPHVPAGWSSFAITGVHVGPTRLDLNYRRTDDDIILEVRQPGSAETTIDFSPALGRTAKVVGADVNNRPVHFDLQTNATDLHPVVRFTARQGTTTLRLRVRNDFAMDAPGDLPPLGETSRNLKIISETWNNSATELSLEVAGLAGQSYDLVISGSAPLANVAGAQIATQDRLRRIHLTIPAGKTGSYVRHTVTLHFGGTQQPAKRSHNQLTPALMSGLLPHTISRVVGDIN